MNSQATSVTGLTPYQLAIVDYFVVWQKFSRTHFGTSATKSKEELTQRVRLAFSALTRNAVAAGDQRNAIVQ